MSESSFKSQEEMPDAQAASIGLSDETLGSFIYFIQNGNDPWIYDALQRLSVYDQAELLSKSPDDVRTRLVGHFLHLFDPVVFTHLDPDLRKATLSSLDAEQVASVVSALESDDALDLILNLDESFQQEIIRKLSTKLRIALEEGLNFPEDSAGRLMQREFVAVPEFWTVGKTLDYLRAAGDTVPADFLDIFAITPSHHVIGEIPLNKIIRAGRSEKIYTLALEDVHIIPAITDQEEVAYLFQREDISSAPVVDDAQRLIGVITVDDVIDVINEEAQEDILKLGGVSDSDIYRAVFDSTRSRFRWLLINLLTAILASVVISFFDATIQEVVALAVLMPIVASMGGNAGTQAMTVAVRAIATKELSGANALRIIWKETLVGILNGLAFALIIGLVAGLWFHNMLLGIVIASAMVINLLIAGASGAGIPVLLNKMGSDPAISSAVVLTTITDIVGFFAFLGLAALVL